MKKAELKEAFKDSLPVLAGYLVLGAGFGILLQSHGYNVWWALVMSVTIFAGSGQYLAVDLLAQAESLVTAALMTFMINARHFFYGLSMLERYKDTKPYKPYLIFGLTDETYSIACSKTFAEGMSPKKYYFYLTGTAAYADLDKIRSETVRLKHLPGGERPGDHRRCLFGRLPAYFWPGQFYYSLHDRHCSGSSGW